MIQQLPEITYSNRMNLTIFQKYLLFSILESIKESHGKKHFYFSAKCEISKWKDLSELDFLVTQNMTRYIPMQDVHKIINVYP